MQASLLDVFVAFFRANILGYGGGPATIPLVEAEVVNNYQWLTEEQFANALAMGNTLPGPIATKIAAYVGYQVAGWPGAFVALLAAVGPTMLAMIGLATLLTRFRDNPVVAGMIKGVRPVVWTLFVVLVLDYLKFVGSTPTAVIAAAAFLLVYVLHIHPAIVVALGLIVGAVAFR